MSEDKTNEGDIEKELSPFTKSFGKVSPNIKSKSSPKKRMTTKRKSQTNVSFIQSFGKQPKKKEKDLYKMSSRRRSSKPKPRKIEIEIVHRDIANVVDAFNCKDRAICDYRFCSNPSCKCRYKDIKPKDAEYEYNKYIIQTKLSKYTLGAYGQNILSFDWYERKTNTKVQKMIDGFIKQCKFLYDLQEIIGHDTETALEPLFDVLNCKDRIEDKKWGCNKWTFKGAGTQLCSPSDLSYCSMNTDKLKEEATKRIFISLLTKNGKISATKWDRIVLSWDWSKLTDKQITSYNRFISSHSKILPKVKNTLSDWFSKYQSKIHFSDHKL